MVLIYWKDRDQNEIYAEGVPTHTLSESVFYCGRFDGKPSLFSLQKIAKTYPKSLRQVARLCPKMPPVFLPNKAMYAAAVQKALATPGLEKVVLARRVECAFEDLVCPWAIAERVFERAGPNTFCSVFCDKDYAFIMASPELLYRRRGRNVETEALAGTYPIQRPPQALLNDHKERHEHALVRDRLVEALLPLVRTTPLCDSVSVIARRHVQHLYCRIQAVLHEGITDEMLLKTLHPTAAVLGTPKEKAWDFLRENEPFDRGYYAGPCGFISANEATFAVGIRSILVSRHTPKAWVYSGAGIVNGSKPENEWAELDVKIKQYMELFA